MANTKYSDPIAASAMTIDAIAIRIFMSGGGEIRTLESLSTLPPFQDGALDRYATPPCVAVIPRIPLLCLLPEERCDTRLNRRMRRKQAVHCFPCLGAERVADEEVRGSVVRALYGPAIPRNLL